MTENKMKIVAGKCPIEDGGNCPLRPQGEWEHDKLFGECAYVCSFCHTIWTSSEIQNMHYCPTCGADMRVKNELKEKEE